ncbi:MAG: EAL domain-containing protein [Actinomycetota bacterium]|nr:EAL domain-containing protein [Actinomycetota bacterium]
MRRLRVRTSLLAEFAAVSFVALAVLGVVLAQTFLRTMHEEERSRATEIATLTAKADVRPRIPVEDLDAVLGNGEETALDAKLHAVSARDGVARVTLWSRNGEVLYSTEAALAGTSAEEPALVRDAAEGNTSTVVSRKTPAGTTAAADLLQVYLPLKTASGLTQGVLEVDFDYASIVAATRKDQQTVLAVLGGSLVLIYLFMLATVARSSRTHHRQARQTEHQAVHDALTGLHNRAYFRDRVEQAISEGKVSGERACLMLIDLDRFKEVNDTLGHHNGDQLLRQIAKRLQTELRESDTVARLGGDEFAVLLTNVADVTQVVRTAERILSCLKQPLFFMGLTLDVGASIGVSMFPDHARGVDALLQRADVAMYAAKETQTGYEFYNPDRDQNSLRRLALGSELSNAIQNKEVVLYYQPKADMRTGKIIGVEALARWQHAYRGIVGPDEFIPLAEQTQLIRPLTMNLLDEAIRQISVWDKRGINLKVAVNLSSRSLLDLQLPDQVTRLLQKWQVEATSLELEITESTIMADARRALAVLSTLNSMGVGLAIDDFGTGFSSLSYLKRLPVREMKMDKSFVMKMAVDENDAAIVRSTIELGHNLGLRVVAEGVENEGIWQQLTALGCDLAQGYYLTRPVPADELEEWLRDYNASRFPTLRHQPAPPDEWGRTLLEDQPAGYLAGPSLGTLSNE